MPSPTNVITWFLKPLSRLIVGAIAIPLVRAVRRRIPGLKEWDAELEKDVEEWFRGSLLLLVATKNAEIWLMTALNAWWGAPIEALGFLSDVVDGGGLGGSEMLEPRFDLNKWWITAGRLLLAIGVIESMPDQELFSIIHPGPKWNYDRKQSLRANARAEWWPICRGLLCQHLNRASPMFAILSVFFGGVHGWVFYSLAIAQYLIIGLVTSRDRAIDVLSQFDEAVAAKRQEIVAEFEIGTSESDSSAAAEQAARHAEPPPPG